MAAGSRTVYKLDLDEIIAFPDSAHVPVLPPEPGESWIIISEIIRDDSLLRPVYLVRDKIGQHYRVAFYTDNPQEDVKQCKIGHVLCIKNGMWHHFLDGSSGYRIEDPEAFFTLPCSLEQLRTMNQDLRNKSDAGHIVACNVCLKPSTKSCSRCKTRYCNTTCQQVDWRGSHRRECPIIGKLHQWNRTDWG